MIRRRDSRRQRRHSVRRTLSIACIVAGVVIVFASFAAANRPGTQPFATPSATAAAVQPSPTPLPVVTPVPTPTEQCKGEWPEGFYYQALGINAKIEAVKMGQHAPVAPTSKYAIGLVDQAGEKLFDNKTPPALPGDCYGNVIAEGHTYSDNSAVFKQDADQHVAVGQTFYFIMPGGVHYTYRVTHVWKDLAKGTPAAGQQTFTQVATQEGFYEPHPGVQQVLLMTCDSVVVNGHHIGELAILAVRVFP